MPEYPLVSIVMPTLNQAQYIREAIDSVLGQDYPNLELIVRDGGSTDGTLDILKSYGNRIMWVSEPDKGQADAINKGVRDCAGLYVSWLNSDDTLLPGAISYMVQEFQRSPGAGVVYGDTLFVGPDGTPMFQSVAWGYTRDDLLTQCHNPIPQPSTLIGREAWQALNWNMKYFFDWDLWLRISEHWDIVYTPMLLSTYRLHDDSKTSNRIPVEELQAMYRRYFEAHPMYRLSTGAAFGKIWKRSADYHRKNGDNVKSMVCEVKAWLSK